MLIRDFFLNNRKLYLFNFLLFKYASKRNVCMFVVNKFEQFLKIYQVQYSFTIGASPISIELVHNAKYTISNLPVN